MTTTRMLCLSILPMNPTACMGFPRLAERLNGCVRALVEVDEVIDTTWNCVIASGRYEGLPNASRYVSERRRAYKLLEKRFLWWQAAYAAEQVRHASQPSPTIFYCIHVADMTGRRAEHDQFDAGRTHRKISG